METRAHLLPLDVLLDKCFAALPVDLTPLLKAFESRWQAFLDGNLLDRLVVTLLNEEDHRISSYATKCQVLSLLRALSSGRAHQAKVRVRLLLQSVSSWIDDILDPREAKVTDLTVELVKVMADAFNASASAKEQLLREVRLGMRAEAAKGLLIKHFAVAQFQALIRGYLARLHLRQTLDVAAAQQRRRMQQWSAVTIQKAARGYIARKTVLRSLKIRHGLSQQVLRLASKYLSAGDLWGFLRDMDEELGRAQREARERDTREEQWANTFVKQVVARRQGEFDGVWRSFPAALQQLQQQASPFGTLDESKPSDSSSSTAVAGPLLRRALSSTVAGQRRAADQRQRARPMLALIQQTYGTGGAPPPATAHAVTTAAAAAALPALKKVPRTGRRRRPRAEAEGDTLQACQADWLTSAGAQAAAAGRDADMDILLRDVPMGMDDSLERLLHAAALRCHVPDFFSSSSSSPSSLMTPYELYLQLPQGLAKMRYELECRRWAQGLVNQLRLQGISSIRQAAPLSRLVALLKDLNAAPPLVKKAADLFMDLKNMSKAAVAGRHPLGSVLTEPVPHPEPAPRISNTAAKEVSAVVAVAVSGERAAAASRLLQRLIEQVNPQSLRASVEEIFVHAAFLVLPHGDDEDAQDMGQHAFQLFGMDLTDGRGEQQQAELVRRRFRAAVMLTTPYTLLLKEQGILTAQQLLEADLTALQLPAALFAQMEIFLNTLSNRMAGARLLPVLRDHSSLRKKEEFMVPMFYDTRFQRTPLDPRGRPSLPVKQRRAFAAGGAGSKNKDKDEGEGQEEGADEVQDLLDAPASLWGQQQQATKGISSNGSSSSSSNPLMVAPAWQVFAKSQTVTADAPIGRKLTLSTSPAKSIKANAVPAAKPAWISADPNQVFKHSLTCPFPNCGAVFSRAYTYEVHLRSHSSFPQYHAFKRRPQLGLDTLCG